MKSYPKRLIEVDLPIKQISAHARREKSIRHGHISTLHIWWARRPLAACRAVICAALWPDPADKLCPEMFRKVAREEMVKWAKNHLDLVSKDSWSRFVAISKDEHNLDDLFELRGALLDFIADFANWDNSTVSEYLETSRKLTQAAHEALGGEPGSRPLVVDPFAGGGSIPLEALRVGAEPFASDLNPVAVLLNKVILEYIPKYGQKLADEVRKRGQWVKEQAERELGEFYPRDPDGATPIAYLWVRTIRCEGPGCGAEVPLLRSLCLSKRRGRMVGMRLVPLGDRSGVDIEIVENPSYGLADQGTVRRGSATCPCCGYTTPVASVRTQLKARRGGAADARLLCVVTKRPGQKSRFYRLPTERDLKAVQAAVEELASREKEFDGPLSLVPDEPLPIMSGVFNAPIYGHNTWGSLFTPRQALALTTLVRLVREAGKRCRGACGAELAEAVATCLALALDRQADYLSSLVVWANVGEFVAHTFGRQALPMIMDFAEPHPFADTSGNWMGAVDWIARVCEANITTGAVSGHVQLATASAHPLPDDAAHALVTDPPYYNAVPYADLSDFFYVWLRRSVGDVHPALFSGPLSPKAEECCEMAGWDSERYPHKDGAWFETQMKMAMAEGRRILAPSGVAVVVFAHKSTSGWEALLQAMVDAGWIVTASWPIDTERPGRLRAQNSAALASSIHLVCRPRENPDGSLLADDIGDWRDVLQQLPERIHEWMPRLAKEGIVGADAIFACLGPALEIFSRYSRVEKANGEQVTLKEYLEHVWAAVAREALNTIFEGADATGFEEDARLTAMWLWTISTGGNGGRNGEGEAVASTGYVLEYDAARKIAQGLGAHLERLSHLVEIKGDKARLLPVSERSHYLFGKKSAQVPKGKRGKKDKQMKLGFMAALEEAEEQAGLDERFMPSEGKTVLDRLHQSMLLFAAGRGEALKRFLVEEGVGRDQRFWSLAQALSALYPANVDEKRWVDGVLARKKSLGF